MRYCECFGNILRFNVIGGSGVLRNSHRRASSLLIFVRSVGCDRRGSFMGIFIMSRRKTEFGTA